MTQRAEHQQLSIAPLEAAQAAGAPSGASSAPAFSFSPNGASSRDEMNLAEFPLAVLSTRSNPKIKTLEFSDYHRQPNGELTERKWIITGADKFGLPTSTDDDVVLGLMRMSMDQGFRDPKVYFTRYELLRTLRWSTEGRSYSRLVKSLDRLSGVRIRSTNAFYDNSSKAYQTRNFGIIDAYDISDERGNRGSSDGEPSKSFFIWSEVLFSSFKAGFVKKLDLDFYFALKSAVSRRLYRYLDKHFYYKSSVELPLQTLAFEKIGLSRSNKYISSIKQQLEPAADELVSLGFLSDYEFSGRGEQATVRFRAKKGEPSKSYAPSLISQTALNSQTASHTQSGAPQGASAAASGFTARQGGNGGQGAPTRSSKLYRALASRGMAEPQAAKLLKRRTRSEYDKIEQIIAYYDHLINTRDRKVSKNPVGFLYRAVETPYRFSIPKEFADSLGHARENRNARGRPELKVFTSAQNTPQPSAEPVSSKTSANGLNDAEVAKAAAKLGPRRVEEVRADVEKRMGFLKSVLRPEHYQEALAGCLKDELARLAN